MSSPNDSSPNDSSPGDSSPDDELPVLEGWPTVSLWSMGPRKVEKEELRRLMSEGSGDRDSICVYRSAPGGSRKVEVSPICADASDKTCREFIEEFLGERTLGWDDEMIVLINQPCFISTSTGVVFLADGRVVSETLFPMKSHDFQARVGAGLDVENIEEKLRSARQLGRGVWAPLFSLGSDVYGHALAESIVQDSALHRAGLSPYFTYVGVSWPAPSRDVVIAHARARVLTCRADLVRVPRVVFASKLYRHRPIGIELETAMRAIRDGAPAPNESPAHGEWVYLSRLGAKNRPMTDEAELIEALKPLGFDIVDCGALTFAQQVATVRNARLVVGPYGSQLTNAAFAPAGAILCELRSHNNPDNSPNLDEFYCALAAAMGQTYAVRIARNRRDAGPWACGVSKTIRLIKGLMTAKASGRGRRAIPDAVLPAAPASTDMAQAAPASVSRFWALPDWTGRRLRGALERAHQNLRPQTYLEIGARSLRTLAMSQCASISVAPRLRLDLDLIGDKPKCAFYRMNGAGFFATPESAALLSQGPALAVFHDRQYLEELLDDFIALEQRIPAGSMLLLSGCLPTDAHAARRLREDDRFSRETSDPERWTGDMWKLAAILRRYRGDLRIQMLDVQPAGLAVVSNFDPQSPVLAQRREDILAEYVDIELADYGVDQFLQEFEVLSVSALDGAVDEAPIARKAVER